MVKIEKKQHQIAWSHLIMTALVLLASLYPITGQSANLTSYTVTDLRVLYVYSDEASIDWPVIFYLNEAHKCRVDLVTIGAESGQATRTIEIENRDIFHHRFYPDQADSNYTDTIFEYLMKERAPDLVILAETSGEHIKRLEEKLLNAGSNPGHIFNISKIYRLAGLSDTGQTSLGTVRLNCRELWDDYYDRIKIEVSEIFPWYEAGDYSGAQLEKYNLLYDITPGSATDPDFVSGLRSSRLVAVIDSVLPDGSLRKSFASRARMFLSMFGYSGTAVGRKRIENIMHGYRSIYELSIQVKSETKLTNIPGFIAYLERARSQAQKTVLHEIGMRWDGDIILRDSPHGPKLKFRATLSVNGPSEIELSYVRFSPYWDTVDVALDSISRKIAPHQSFVREYLVDIERSRLEAKMPESLTFVAEIVYGRFPMIVKSSLPIWEKPDINVRFQPGFHFIQPFARLNVDKVVASMNWKAIIDKPMQFHGNVKIELVTPRGVFAGAYRQEVQLDKGSIRETVRIPFSVSNLFELGVQQQIINLLINDRVVASDTGIIRIATCKIADTIAVGFLPDTTGLLEDILRMTDANFRPMTDRSLLTGDLDAYNVIVIGSGAARGYPSLRSVRGRFEDYIRAGGSIVVFGQPGDWPERVLPVALSPKKEMIRGGDLLNRIEGARILSSPHVINEADLLSWLDIRRELAAGLVSPAEKVYVTPSGATLLSVSRLGSGQIIYCGLPLTEMISELNIEAIHLFSNILNY